MSGGVGGGAGNDSPSPIVFRRSPGPTPSAGAGAGPRKLLFRLRDRERQDVRVRRRWRRFLGADFGERIRLLAPQTSVSLGPAINAGVISSPHSSRAAGCLASGERLPSGEDDIAVPRFQLRGVADPTRSFGRDKGRSRPSERIQHDPTGRGGLQAFWAFSVALPARRSTGRAGCLSTPSLGRPPAHRKERRRCERQSTSE